LAFPLRNPINDLYDGVTKKYKLGMAITLMPHSNVSYNILAQDSLSGIGSFKRNYVGTGGTYKLLWGNSIKVKDFSFGVNLGYLFGQIKYERNITFQDIDYPYNNLLANDYNVSGFLWNAGMIYTKVLNNEALKVNKIAPVKRISIGFHANSSNKFNTSSNINERLVQTITGGFVNIDTVRIVNELSGKGKLPAELGFGMTYYSGEKNAIGFNYSTTFWSSYFNEATSDVEGSLKNSSKISIGGFYRPNYKSFDNMLERFYYRYGIYYQTDPRVIGNEQVTGYGVSLGLGMPYSFQRKISHLNLGLTAGLRGQNTPISERFVKISLGVTFNDDEWFLKRKYN
jgi:hypothetical protein